MRATGVIVAVLLLDIFVFAVGRVVTMEANQMEIMRALQAETTNPGRDARRRVDAAFATAKVIQTGGMLVTLAVILLITSAGVVAVKRRRPRGEPVQGTRSDPPASHANT